MKVIRNLLIILDGTECHENYISLVNDRREHLAEIILNPDIK